MEILDDNHRVPGI
jgi:NADH-quinone oxidoreductase subunit J